MKPEEWVSSTHKRWDSGHLYEGAQHLAAALEEIARLQAQLAQAVPVVVPECGYRFNTHCLCAVPSSRVLKDGEVAVAREEWEAMCDLGFDPEPCRFDSHGYCQEHNWFSEKPCPTAILQRLYALRAQGKEKP